MRLMMVFTALYTNLDNGKQEVVSLGAMSWEEALGLALKATPWEPGPQGHSPRALVSLALRPESLLLED